MGYDAGNVTHRRWMAQAQMKLEDKQKAAVSCIPGVNRCLARDKMRDDALHPWRRLTRAVGQTNGKGL
jgi:hypothetical protein